MGGSGAAQQSIQQNSAAQDAIAVQQNANSQADRASRDAAQAPAISLYSKLTSGDPNAAMTAAAPMLAPISQGFQASKDSIFNNVSAGAGRDAALANLTMNKNSATAGVFSSATAGAYDKLANIGSGLGAFSLQDIGASLSGYSGSTQGYQAAGQMASADKASTMNFLGSLAGGATDMATAGIAKCWIAEAIYGIDDQRTHLVRAWLNGPFEEDSSAGRFVMWLYGKFGRKVAAATRRSSLLRSALKPLFDAALRRAQEYFQVYA